MGYKPGDTVIITREGINHVGVVLDKQSFNKQTLYDVMLENRSCITMLNTSTSKKTYINKTLTAKLCDTDMIQTTIPYKEMLANDDFPIYRSQYIIRTSNAISNTYNNFYLIRFYKQQTFVFIKKTINTMDSQELESKISD